MRREKEGTEINGGHRYDEERTNRIEENRIEEGRLE